MPSWWGWATENTLDRATAHLPALALRTPRRDRHRLHDPLSVDDARVPRGRRRRADRPALSRREPRARQPVRARTGTAPPSVRSIPMLDPKLAIDELEYAVRELGFKTAVFAGHARRPIGDSGRLPARHVRRRQRVRLRPAVGQVRRARHRARVPQLAAGASRHAIGDELRVQPRRRSRGEPRIAVQVAVPVGRDPPLPDAALRLPRRRRRLGLQPARRPGRALGEAQRAARSAHSIPTGSTSTRCSRCSSSTATTACAPGSRSCATYFTRPSARPEQLDEFAAAALESVDDLRDRFVPNFYFGCEADDRLVAWAFAEHVNPAGARLRPIFGSDISHWDVPDMTEPVEEALRARRGRPHHRAGIPRAHLPQPGTTARRNESRVLRGHRVRERGARRGAVARIDRLRRSIVSATRELGNDVERRVTEEVARALAEHACTIIRVVEPTGLQRQAPAADARRQVVAHALQAAGSARRAPTSTTRDSRAQSAAVGVRCSGRVASAPRISSRVRPTRWATRMNAIRRNASRGNRR